MAKGSQRTNVHVDGLLTVTLQSSLLYRSRHFGRLTWMVNGDLAGKRLGNSLVNKLQKATEALLDT